MIINNAWSSNECKVLAVRKLESGDIVITTDIHKTMTLMELREGWK
jgi:hypothetical protein